MLFLAVCGAILSLIEISLGDSVSPESKSLSIALALMLSSVSIPNPSKAYRCKYTYKFCGIETKSHGALEENIRLSENIGYSGNSVVCSNLGSIDVLCFCFSSKSYPHLRHLFECSKYLGFVF